MRKEFQKIEDYRGEFIGTFTRYGKKQRYKPIKVGDDWIHEDVTILLTDIKDPTGKYMCDHIWCNMTKGFQALGELSPGDKIQFAGRVTPYVKGYYNYRKEEDYRELDYKLSRPTKIRKLDADQTIHRTECI